MTKTCIRVPLYGISITVIIDDDVHKSVARLSKKNKWILNPDFTKPFNIAGLAVYQGSEEYYIFFEKKHTSVNTVTHEITHVIERVFENKYIEDESEALAYLTGYVTEKIFDFLLSKQLLINKWIIYPKNKVTK